MTAAQENPPHDEAPEPVLREDVLSYTPVPAAVPRCRRRATRLVAEWGYPELADDTALLVSELATNALLHGGVRGRLFRLRLALTASALRIEVTDARADRLPDTRTPLDADCYGRGLLIVAELADHWGVEHRTVGKTVFAELSLRRPGSTPPAPR